MGLFSREPSKCVENGRWIIGIAINDFNDRAGAAYSVRAELNEGGLADCVRTFDEVSRLGFPGNAGPFKWMAGLVVLSQHIRLVNFFHVRMTSQTPFAENEYAKWTPRFALWACPILSQRLKLDDGTLIGSFKLPTPHFQVEFISMLRAFARGAELGDQPAETALLLERCTSTGLILESAAYSDASHQCIENGTDYCIEEIQRDPDLADDLRFNDPEFLELALEMGFD